MTPKQEIKQLVDKITSWSDAYYNTGKPLVSDKVFDKAVDRLKEIDPQNKVLKQVRAPVKNVKLEVPYTVPSPSLDKIRAGTGQLEKFEKKNKNITQYVISDKEDGMGLQLTYDASSNTGFPLIIAGGDATTGQDVSFLAPHLKIPKLKKNLVVRGEAIISKSAFKKYSDEFKNARNLAGGVVNKTKGVHKAIKDVSFVAYEIQSKAGTPSENFKTLQKLGFEVAWHKVVTRISESVLTSILRKRKAESPYTIDGIVVTADIKTTIKASNPTHAFAFKEEGEDNLARTTVESVVWQISKLGRLKPRIKIEPVELAGATVTYASGKNAKFIYNNKIGPGTVLEIVRSGEVIPDVVKIIKSTKPQMPDEYDWHWNDNKVEAYADADASDVMLAKQIHSFLKQGLGTKHIAVKSIIKCIEAGIDTPGKFLRASAKKFMQVEGVKSTMANKWVNEIKKGASAADLASVAGSLNYFGENFGSKRVQKIIDKYDLHKLSTKSEGLILKAVLKIPGFKETTALPFAQGLKAFITWLDKQPITFKKKEKVKVEGSSMQDQVVVFTGFRDKSLEDRIKVQGGTIGSGVSSKTTILVVKDKSFTSSKVDKAKSLGIKVFTSDELIKRFKL